MRALIRSILALFGVGPTHPTWEARRTLCHACNRNPALPGARRCEPCAEAA